ncbi:hypothetical protein OC861_002340 [Tilletia horrida]|nr:hypothetical protein OC861_002340 [Tilletia horrida]
MSVVSHHSSHHSDLSPPQEEPIKPFRLEVWRARFDTAKTATPVRRTLLGCLVEMIGVFMTSFPPLCTFLAIGLSDIPAEFRPAISCLMGSIVCLLSIWLGLTVCMSTTRGFLHPCLTVLGCLLGMCGWIEGFFYVIAHTVGGFLSASAAVLIHWKSIKPILDAVNEGMLPPEIIWSSSGVAAAITNMKPLHQDWMAAMLNGFICALIGCLVICAALDATNAFSSPSMFPMLMGAMLSLLLMANVGAGVSQQPALWLGGRMSCAAIFGHADRCFPVADTLFIVFGPWPGTYVDPPAAR